MFNPSCNVKGQCIVTAVVYTEAVYCIKINRSLTYLCSIPFEIYRGSILQLGLDIREQYIA